MNTPVQIAALHAAIKLAISAQFPGVFVDFYPRPGDRITVPAILLEMEDMAVDSPDDIGTEQLPVKFNFNAYAVLSYKQGNKLALRTMAASLLHFVRAKRWTQPVSPADVVGAFPDQFSSDSKEYEVMRIEFSHQGLLGTDAWSAAGIIPTEIWVGYSPEIGPANESEYQLSTPFVVA